MTMLDYVCIVKFYVNMFCSMRIEVDVLSICFFFTKYRVLRLTAGHKYCLLGQLSSEVGWNHYETIKVYIHFLFL